MLTVMIRHRTTKREVIYQANAVEFEPVQKGTYGEGAGLLIENGDDAQHIGVSATEDDLRDVFVMNENGATVARYEL